MSPKGDDKKRRPEAQQLEMFWESLDSGNGKPSHNDQPQKSKERKRRDKHK